MSSQPVRWGFLGTANIARKNWHAIHLSGNSVLTAVASRDVARAERFIAECQASVPLPHSPRALGSYEALLASPEVDAVYIPLPTGLRKEWVIRAAEAGKHVVCEKPCAINSEDLEEMTSACEQAGVQFMDGVMFVHSGRMQRLRELLADGSVIGDIRRVTSQFSFRGDEGFFSDNIRSRSTLEPQGCLGDLGWYSLVFTLEVMRGRMPHTVIGRRLSKFGHPDSPEPIPSEFSAELLYEDGVSASFYSSFLTENQQWASVSGSRGHLHVSDFVLPFFGSESGFNVDQPQFHILGCRFNMESHRRQVVVSEHSNNHATSQETRLFRHFSELVASGKLHPHWPEQSLKTQKLLDLCFESAALGLPVEVD
jgi:predicted dehydrogenase